MTTLVATRQAFELISMNKQPARRTSKRLAAATDYEGDGDFQFVRKSKKAKTEASEAAPPVKKTGKGRPPRTSKVSQQTDEIAAETPTAASKVVKKPTKKKSAPEVIEEETELQEARRGTRRSARLSVDREGSVEEAQRNGASKSRDGRKGKTTRKVPPPIEESPIQEESVQSAKITLPMSDTPIINRNKEMRKKGGAAGRRSSLGSRGRRASSLIQSGNSALPHREVDTAEFYKHIEEGLPEPRRMKQLLTWCGERALSEKPPHGTLNSSAIHGARAIQDQLLKDFGSRSEFSDWFSRDEDADKAPPTVLKPNPRNIELDEKLAQLELNINRLQGEKEAWQAMKKPPPEQPPIFSEKKDEPLEIPDLDLLEDGDVKIREFLADEASSFDVARSQAEAKVQRIRSLLEIEIDKLADNMHKLEQRVAVAGEEADKVLSLSALRLKEREEKEKTSAGTKNMPIMEVLRSLGNILPEGG